MFDRATVAQDFSPAGLVTMYSVTAFAPATVANVACGFDVLGFAIDGPGDEVTVRFGGAGVTIEDITGDDGRLPRDPRRNTAGAAAQAVLNHVGE
jgi:homoserine kinase